MEETAQAYASKGSRKTYSRKASRMRKEPEETVVILNEPFSLRQNFNLIS